MPPQLSVQIINVDAPLAIDLHANPLGELHYGPDFDVIAAVTGQPTRWIASAGSL